MKKINFAKLPCYVDIRKVAKKEMDMRMEFSNQMYIHGRGVAMGALAIKIYNATGEEEYNEEECNLILDFAKNYPPVFYDSLLDIIGNNDNETD